MNVFLAFNIRLYLKFFLSNLTIICIKLLFLYANVCYNFAYNINKYKRY